MSADRRDDLIEKAKLAESAERYEDMRNFMKDYCKKLTEPTKEAERNLLSVAYKNVVGARRSAWRLFEQTEVKESKDSKDEKMKEKKIAIIRWYKEKVENELNETCDEILALLDTVLVKNADNCNDQDGYIFYKKMEGDYYRYKVEIARGQNRTDLAKKSEKAYKDALLRAEGESGEGLAPTHPIRLGLALNFSVYYYEIMDEPEQACNLAKKAFDDAIAELDSVEGEHGEERYKDSTLILQLLRDNLTLWTSEMEQGQEDQ